MIDKKLVFSQICILLLAASLAAVIMLGRGDGRQLEMLESQISNLNFQLTSANNEKSRLESQVSDFQSNLNASEPNKTALQSQISNLQTEITNLESQISNLQTEITNLENEALQSYNEGFDDGKAASYNETVVDYVRDPTYAEALDFIFSDQTDKNDYLDDYICMNFASDFKKNAYEAGFRAGCVYIAFPERYHHGIACFNTVDNGLIFVETQTDEIVTLAIGEVYYNRATYGPPYFDDTIVHYVIIW
jgi:cell division protein FtsL